MARGDVVLCRDTDQGFNSFTDKMIEYATRGPYVHCEIDLGDGKFIGAHDRGITLVGSAEGSSYVYVPLKASPQAIEAGLQWAMNLVDTPYGWTDIYDDVFKFMGIPLSIKAAKWMDCSDFVTRYLSVVGVCPVYLAQHPETVSPNDLARFFHAPGALL